jgi:hypothetical protein
MPIKCYDTVDPNFQGGVPSDAQAILFYRDGLTANEQGARARFPNVFAVGMAIGLTVRGATTDPGDDFEPGNWQGDVGQWVRACIANGIYRPVIYADGSDMDNTVFPELEAVFGRPLAPPGPGRRFRTILANPDGDPTIPPDHDGKQYWWGSIQGGGSVDMDISMLRDDFFRKPGPSPHPIQEDDMITTNKLADGRLVVFVEKADTGEVLHTWQAKEGGWNGAEQGKRNAGWLSLGVPQNERI